MRKTFFALALLAVLVLNAQETDPVLMTIDGKPVMASEFIYIYEKNNQETSLDPKTMDEYLDLFVNFKLKVAEAQTQGLDTTASFKKELAGYRAQATTKYLQDPEAIDGLVRMSYGRMAVDRRAAHIAIQCPRNAPDSVVEEALEKINEARIRVTTGLPVKKGRRIIQLEPEDFKTVAREVSTDPTVAETEGELGWITPFRYIYALENAVYNTPVGEVSEVIRSPYGFHIVLVEEERPHEEVHASHIMKMVPRGNATAKETMKRTADSIVQLLTTENFAEKAMELSDDKGSARRGGDLGWFGRGMMVKPFEDATFGMQVGEISTPIESDFGWHIIYLQGKRNLLPLDSMYNKIEMQVKRDERMGAARQSFIEKTRKEYDLPQSMSDAEVYDYADAHLEEKYVDLKNLVREYHDGILLFEVSLREVWDKAAKDTLGLQQFFMENKKKYKWEQPKYKGWVVYCKDEATMKAAKSIIRNSDRDSIGSYLEHRLNIDSVTYVKYEYGLWEKGKELAVDRFGFKNKKTEYVPDEAFPYVLCVGKVLKAPTEYTDERSKVTTDYQDYLEKEWVRVLREKYKVVINQEVFEQLKK